MAKSPYKVRTAFVVDRDTQLELGRKVFAADTIVWLDPKTAKKFATMLEDAEPDSPVERATAAPGEKRTVKKPKKNASKDS